MKSNSHSREEATPEDIIRTLGEVDADTLVAIMALRPNVAALDEVVLRLAGDGEAVGGRQATGVVAEILDLISTDEEEDAALGQVSHST